MQTGLTERQIAALADVFDSPQAARQVLAEAGIPAAGLPFAADSPQVFWAAVSTVLATGVAPGGVGRLLAVAREYYPNNPAFAGGGGRRAVWGSSWQRLRASQPLPAPFVRRDDLVEQVVDLLTTDGTATVGLIGEGGTGTSTAARAVLHDERIARRFVGGAVWVDAGPGADVRVVQERVLAAFADPRTVTEVADGRQRLGELLAGTPCLVVLDDVREAAVVQAFPRVTGVRLLVTSRSPLVLPADASICPVGLVEEATARRLLAAYARCPVDALPPGADEVLTRAGGWRPSVVVTSRWPCIIRSGPRLRRSRMALDLR